MGSGRAPSRHDFSSARTPSRWHDQAWQSYAVKRIRSEGGFTRISLSMMTGTGLGPSRTVPGQPPLQTDDLVFVNGPRISYFDPASGEPVVVEDAEATARIAEKPITERDRQHVTTRLADRVAADEITADNAAAMTAGVSSARTRGDLAGALQIEVTDLKLARPHPGNLLLLAIGFVQMVAAFSIAGGTPSVPAMTPGMVLAASAVYRLTPDMERGARAALGVMAALALLFPVSLIGVLI
ncbi:hypothetical protein J3R03_000328 [Actinoplanes couchii]|nr:hypothetical protein [Actinoplanes couchii]MDR6316132.1 hypothetical protein [Actinoplanes couchii]